MDNALFPPGHPDAPPAPVQAAPPGMAWCISPAGERVLGYVTLPERAPEAAAPIVVQRDVWPARLISGGGATAAVIGAVAMAGPHLAEAGHAVEMAGIGIAATAAGVGMLTVLVKGSINRRQAAQPNLNLTVNVTNTSTSTSTSKARSRR